MIVTEEIGFDQFYLVKGLILNYWKGDSKFLVDTVHRHVLCKIVCITDHWLFDVISAPKNLATRY